MATASKVRPTTPWSRRAMAQVDVASIERIVPDGYYVAFSAHRRPGVWVVWLMTDAERPADRKMVGRSDPVSTFHLPWAVGRLLRDAGIAA